MLKNEKTIRLGLFVVTGLFLLILLLYLIGKNRNIFGSNFLLKAHFQNVNGLESGNNVRFEGITAGTVEEIVFLNDTVIEVSMLLKKNFKSIIRKNAIASIGSDGLVGNKIINIVSSSGNADWASPGDCLNSRKSANTDQMLQTLSISNENIKVITDSSKNIISKFSKGSLLYTLINNDTISKDLKQTIENIKLSSEQILNATKKIHNMSEAVYNKKGTMGKLIYDSSVLNNLEKALESIKNAGDDISQFSNDADTIAHLITTSVKNKNNSAGLIFNDSVLSNNISQTIINIKESAAHFDENMKALQHSIFLRGYFKHKKKKSVQ